MSDYAFYIHDLIKEIRRINPKVYIVWGGVHPIIVPEDAITSADGICTGEGEFAFQEFFNNFKNGKDFTNTRNFWFRENGNIIRNSFLPLMTSEEMTNLPLLEYASGDELIYERGKGFIPLTTNHYLKYNDFGYNTIWSIGCPFKCTFCGNTKFIENDKFYQKMRHPSIEYIIREIKAATRKHPFIGSVIFHDDSFMALKPEILQEFANKYKKEIDIPFAVMGVIPNYVNEDKFDILVRGGMNRIRMGIQSGSERILKFYRRPSPPKRIYQATEVISKFTPYMIAPAYDIIVDNPIETKKDVQDTLRLLFNMPRPFTVNPYSLRVIENTEMAKQFKELGLSHKEIASNYLDLAPTSANALLYLLATFRPPKFLFEWWVNKVQPFHVQQKMHPIIITFFRFCWMARRVLSHIRQMDLAPLPGHIGLFLNKIGLIKFFKKHFVKSLNQSNNLKKI